MKKNLLLFFAMVVFSLFALELALRFIYPDVPKAVEKPKENWATVPERVWTEYHPVLGWYHQKKKQAVLKLKDREFPIRTNTLGFRGVREYSPVKPEGVSRMLVLGDSFVFGYGVGEEETYPALLEKRFPSLEVPNMGVAGYGIDQILLLYRTLGKALKPDCVLIGIFPEDFWRATRAFADSGHAKPYFTLSSSGRLVQHNLPVPPDFSLKTDQFPALVEHSAAENFLLSNSVLYRRLRRALFKLGKNLGLADPELSEEWQLGREILITLVREVQASGARAVITLNPPDRWIKEKRSDGLHRSLLRLAKRENWELLDLTPEFKSAAAQTSLTDYYIQDDWHWTARGQKLAADRIAAYLIEKGFLLPVSDFSGMNRVKDPLVPQTAVKS